MRHRLTRTLMAIAAIIAAAVAVPISANPAGAQYGAFLYNDYRLDAGPTVHGIVTNLDPAFPKETPTNGGYASQYILLRNASGAYLEVGIFQGWITNSYPLNGSMYSGLLPRYYWCDEIPGVYQRWCHSGPQVLTSPVTLGLNAAPYGGGTAVLMGSTWDFSTYLQSDGNINQALIGLKSWDWYMVPGQNTWRTGRFYNGVIARNSWANPYADLGWQSIDNMNSGAANNTNELDLYGWPISNMNFAMLGRT